MEFLTTYWYAWAWMFNVGMLTLLFSMMLMALLDFEEETFDWLGLAAWGSLTVTVVGFGLVKAAELAKLCGAG